MLTLLHSGTPDLPKAELCAIVTRVVTKLCAAPTSPTALILNLFCNSNKSKLSFPERSRAVQGCKQLQSSVLMSGKELLSRVCSFLFLSNFSQSEPELHYWHCGKGSNGGLAWSIQGGRWGWRWNMGAGAQLWDAAVPSALFCLLWKLNFFPSLSTSLTRPGRSPLF